MFKEGISNYTEHVVVKHRDNHGNNSSKEKEAGFQRVKRLSIIAGALTTLLAGGLAEYRHLKDHDAEDDKTEETNINIYLSEDKPEVEEIRNSQPPETRAVPEKTNAKKVGEVKKEDVFIETIQNREITEIERKLIREIPLYGREASSLKRKIPSPSEYYKAPQKYCL